MGCGAESSAHRDRLWETMDQVIDEPDECVLSTDQLTLMRLWLLLAKYFPPLLFSHARVLRLLPFALLSSHVLRWKSRVIVVAAGLLAMYTAEWRNIYMMGYGDASVQFACLWARDDAPFSLIGELTNLLVRLRMYTQEYI